MLTFRIQLVQRLSSRSGSAFAESVMYSVGGWPSRVAGGAGPEGAACTSSCSLQVDPVFACSIVGCWARH